MNTMMKRAVSI